MLICGGYFVDSTCPILTGRVGVFVRKKEDLCRTRKNRVVKGVGMYTYCGLPISSVQSENPHNHSYHKRITPVSSEKCNCLPFILHCFLSPSSGSISSLKHPAPRSLAPAPGQDALHRGIVIEPFCLAFAATLSSEISITAAKGISSGFLGQLLGVIVALVLISLGIYLSGLLGCSSGPWPPH